MPSKRKSILGVVRSFFQGLKQKLSNLTKPKAKVWTKEILLLNSVEIDIGHNWYDKQTAKKILEKKIMESYRSNKKAVKVIHGFNNGTVIKDMVHNELNMKVIKTKYKDYPNKGVTLIELKENVGE